MPFLLLKDWPIGTVVIATPEVNNCQGLVLSRSQVVTTEFCHSIVGTGMHRRIVEATFVRPVFGSNQPRRNPDIPFVEFPSPARCGLAKLLLSVGVPPAILAERDELRPAE